MTATIRRQERRAPRVSAAGVVVAGRLGEPKTASSLIHRELRHEIVSMQRKPGEPISEKTIAAAHGVSRTPVREALLRLAEERLVDIFPQSGTFVSRIPIAGLSEAIIVRTSLEGTMARLAAERRDPRGLAQIDRALESQKAAARANDREAFHEADEAFHAAIAEAAGYPGVWTLVQTVKTQVDRYRRLTLPVPGRMHAVVEEHRPIVAAIAAGKPNRAAKAMAEHLQSLMTFADIRHLNPAYFLDETPLGVEQDRA
jgi:DNA-binding GntR family transcriptional regulator